MARPDRHAPPPARASASPGRWRAAVVANALPALSLLGLSLLAGYLASPRAATASGRYRVGEFTSAAVRAPYDFSVIDDEATRQRRDEARRASPAVAVVEPGVPGAIVGGLRDAFRGPNEVLLEAARRRDVQAAELAGLSESRRRNLRRERNAAADQYLRENLDAAVESFERAVGVALTPDERTLLVREEFGEPLVAAAATLVNDAYARPLAADPEAGGAAAPGADVGSTLQIRNARTGVDGAILDVATVRTVSAARADLEARAPGRLIDIAPDLRPLLARIVAGRLVPNVAIDRGATAARREAAAGAVIPVSLNFRRNQLIVGEGQEVTRTTELVLAYLGAQARPRAYAARSLGAAALVCLLLLVTFHVARAGSTESREGRAARDILYIASSLAVAWVAFWIWLLVVDGFAARYPEVPRLALILMFPFAALPLHTRLMTGLEVARTQLVVYAVVVGLLSELGLVLTAFVLATGLLGAHLAGGCRRRGSILRAGFWTGALSAAVAVPVALLATSDWTGTPWVALGGMAGGVAAGLAVVAASRVAEWAFGYTTPVRLLEMVSYEQPLLRDLAVRAPGTFQHSIAVAVLADAAAQKIGADALLVRAGALYHDVGKTLHPEFFTENQVEGNPHERLAPRESAAIIRAHVADGVALVTAGRLGDVIADFVREHHGRSTVSYFLEIARRGGGPVDVEDYRYPGPSPGSRETAILMIADRVEATSRSMPGAPEPEIRAMVEATVDRLRAEGELARAPLTLRELQGIVEALAQALGGVRHQRVAYPKGPAPAFSRPVGRRSRPRSARARG